MVPCPVCGLVDEIYEDNSNVYPFFCDFCGSVFKFHPYNWECVAEKIEEEFKESQKQKPRPLDITVISVPLSICKVLQSNSDEMEKLKALLSDKISKYLMFSTETGALILQLPFEP